MPIPILVGTARSFARPEFYGPASVKGLETWLDGADRSTLFQESTFATAAAANNDPVGGWKDKGPYARHQLQATAGLRPLLQTATNEVLFDGSSQFTEATFTLNQPITMFAVLRQVTWTLNDYLWSADSTLVAGIQSNISPRIQPNAGAGVNNYTTLLNTRQIFTTVYTGASSWCQADDLAVISGNMGTNNMGGLTLGANGAGSANGNVAFSEILLYNRELTTVEITRIKLYLKRKWGTT